MPNKFIKYDESKGAIVGGFVGDVELGNTGILKSPTIKETPVIGSELLTNPGFETWTEADPTGYTIIEAGNPGQCGTYAKEIVKIRTGLNSFKVIAGAAGSQSPQQFKTGLIPGASYQCQMYGRNDVAASGGTIGMLVMNKVVTEGGVFSVWDETTQVFVETVDPTPYFVDVNLGTETYTAGTVVVVADAQAQLAILPVFLGAAENEVCYFDDLSIKSYTAAPAILPFLLDNDSDVKDMSVYDDQMIGLRFNDSTGVATNPLESGKYIPLAMTRDEESGRIMFFSDGTGYDLRSYGTLVTRGGVAVGTPTIPQDALNATNTQTVLATSAAINMKTVAITLLYTVPAGYTLHLDHVDFVPTIDTLTDGPVFQIGDNTPDWSNFNGWAEIVSDDWVNGQLISLMAGATVGASYVVKARYDAGSEIKLNVQTGAVATTYTGIFKVIGYLVAN